MYVADLRGEFVEAAAKAFFVALNAEFTLANEEFPGEFVPGDPDRSTSLSGRVSPC
jgi:hypothetical protein